MWRSTNLRSIVEAQEAVGLTDAPEKPVSFVTGLTENSALTWKITANTLTKERTQISTKGTASHF